VTTANAERVFGLVNRNGGDHAAGRSQ
jgi:hypothetical protein